MGVVILRFPQKTGVVTEFQLQLPTSPLHGDRFRSAISKKYMDQKGADLSLGYPVQG